MIVKNLPDDSLINSIITSLQNQGKVIDSFERVEKFRQGTNISNDELFVSSRDIYYYNQNLSFYNSTISGYNILMKKKNTGPLNYTLIDMLIPANGHYYINHPYLFNFLDTTASFTTTCTMTWVGYKIITV